MQLPYTMLTQDQASSICLALFLSYYFLKLVHCHCLGYVEFPDSQVSLQMLTWSSSSSASTILWFSAEFNTIDYQSPACNPICMIRVNRSSTYPVIEAMTWESSLTPLSTSQPILHQVLSIVSIALKFAHSPISMV